MSLIDTPQVTVVLPVYNGGMYLYSAIESLLAQTYKNLEILILNDASTDNSVAIAESFGDKRIRILHNERNAGIVYTLNKGIDAARGAYIARMDADDICLPERIEKQVSFLLEYPAVGMVDTIMEYIDEHGRSLNRTNSPVFEENRIRKVMLYTNCLGHSSVMLRAEIFRRFRYRNIPFEDYDLWLRLLNARVRICKIPEPLLQYRIHPSSIMANASAKRRLSLARTKQFYYSRLDPRSKLKLMNLIILSGSYYDLVNGMIRDIRGKMNR